MKREKKKRKGKLFNRKKKAERNIEKQNSKDWEFEEKKWLHEKRWGKYERHVG